MKTLLTTFKVLFLLVVLIVSLISGAIIEKFGIFPISDRVNYFIMEIPFVERIKTKLKWSVLDATKGEISDKTVFSNNLILNFRPFKAPSTRKYGGIEIISDKLFYVDGEGKGWIRDGDNFLLVLDDPIPSNSKIFEKTHTVSESYLFGVKDILVSSYLKSDYLLISTNNYNAVEECYYLSVFKKKISYENEVPLFNKPWVNLFNSSPCIKSKNGKLFDGTSSGGRLVNSEPGKVFFSTGDFYFDGVNDDRLSPESDYSKVFEFSFLNKEEPKVIGSGFRNPQGLVKVGNGLFETEHGPQGGDELNFISLDSEEVKDYGWPDATYGVDYGKFEWPFDKNNSNHQEKGFVSPKMSWIPSIGTSNLILIEQNNFKGWKDNLLIGTLRDKSLYRVVLNGSEVSGIERINIEIRSRDILESSKGVFILEDSNPPNIWEMTPSN